MVIIIYSDSAEKKTVSHFWPAACKALQNLVAFKKPQTTKQISPEK